MICVHVCVHALHTICLVREEQDVFWVFVVLSDFGRVFVNTKKHEVNRYKRYIFCTFFLTYPGNFY